MKTTINEKVVPSDYIMLNIYYITVSYKVYIFYIYLLIYNVNYVTHVQILFFYGKQQKKF